jgi:hypothetical protein
MSSTLFFSPKEIVDAALDKYARLTEKSLKYDKLAIEIQRCLDAAAIRLVLWRHVQAFPDHSELMMYLDAIVGNLYNFWTSPVLSKATRHGVVSLRDCILFLATLY